MRTAFERGAQVSRVKHRVINLECRQFAHDLRKQFVGRLPPAIAERVEKLRRYGDRLLLTWSDMAGRNILNDMLRTVRQLEQQLTGRPKAAAAALLTRLENSLAQHAITRARYDSVLCLGYKVQTSGFERYQGDVDDYTDMRSKCRDMIEAIRAARGLVSAAEQMNTRMLKIFMAPEFFFRGANGGYDYDVVLGRMTEAQQGLLEIMQEEIGNSIYNDWLFVLGTVVAVSQHTRLACKSCAQGIDVQVVKGVRKSVCKGDPEHVLEDEVLGARADNIAYVCKQSEVYTVSKELISEVDYIANRKLPSHVNVRGQWTQVQRYEHRKGIYSASNEATRFQNERMGGCIFTLDGITFGLEVCMDHAYTPSIYREGRLDHAGNIQIQLVPSAGINISHLRTIPGGVVFNVDGYPAVQIVGERKGQIRVFESCKRNRVIAFDSWRPQPILDRLDPDDKLNRSNDGWYRPTNVRIAGAPEGSVVGYGPFEIPPV